MTVWWCRAGRGAPYSGLRLLITLLLQNKFQPNSMHFSSRKLNFETQRGSLRNFTWQFSEHNLQNFVARFVSFCIVARFFFFCEACKSVAIKHYENFKSLSTQIVKSIPVLSLQSSFCRQSPGKVYEILSPGCGIRYLTGFFPVHGDPDKKFDKGKNR